MSHPGAYRASSTALIEFDVDAAVVQAWAIDGYINDEGGLDREKVRARLLEVVQQAKVIRSTERGRNAITRGAIVNAVLPSLPDPDELDGQDAVNARLVRAKLDTFLWNETKPDANSILQRMVGYGMGNGYVLLRTKVGREGNQIDAAYVTDSMALIKEDLVNPDSQALERKASQVRRNLEMLMTRQPESAQQLVRIHDRNLKSILEAGHTQLALTADAVTTAANGADDSGDQDE